MGAKHASCMLNADVQYFKEKSMRWVGANYTSGCFHVNVIDTMNTSCFF